MDGRRGARERDRHRQGQRRFRPDAMVLDLLVSEGVPVGFSQMFIEATMIGQEQLVGGSWACNPLGRSLPDPDHVPRRRPPRPVVTRHLFAWSPQPARRPRTLRGTQALRGRVNPVVFFGGPSYPQRLRGLVFAISASSPRHRRHSFREGPTTTQPGGLPPAPSPPARASRRHGGRTCPRKWRCPP